MEKWNGKFDASCFKKKGKKNLYYSNENNPPVLFFCKWISATKLVAPLTSHFRWQLVLLGSSIEQNKSNFRSVISKQTKEFWCFISILKT